MRKIVIIFIISLLVTSCEDVIDVNLNTADPRLVIDASILWNTETTGSTQLIQLSLTAPYFSDTIPPATGATVTVTDSSNEVFNFTEEDATGKYINIEFTPKENEDYTLTILYNNETYTATETMTSVVPIEYVEQKNDGGFSGEEIEIKAYYQDPAEVQNYYLFDFFVVDRETASIEVYDDEFTDGNEIFAFYSNEDLKAGDTLVIRNSGISQRTYEFFNILLQQTDDDSGDPFQTQPATVRGNCINQTNPDNYPLGYFRVSRVDTFNYVVQ
ncbi:DUF4249 domain-containing protein [Algibacter pectinivorans]|uniref:DUF4249 domain-containing protein n=1 Tax=Algibacter pectinivorans TaxID=870482 RepID=A0A1I1S147_9FLAO|nr:DUF4249 domain-containing protein [Algibacter pectinivorans]SFD38278.1 protein of unknown function [Algibacter pectinivorans]